MPEFNKTRKCHPTICPGGRDGERKTLSSLDSQKEHLSQHTPIVSCTDNRLQILLPVPPQPQARSPLVPGPPSDGSQGFLRRIPSSSGLSRPDMLSEQVSLSSPFQMQT